MIERIKYAIKALRLRKLERLYAYRREYLHTDLVCCRELGAEVRRRRNELSRLRATISFTPERAPALDMLRSE